MSKYNTKNNFLLKKYSFYFLFYNINCRKKIEIYIIFTFFSESHIIKIYY